MATFVTLEEGHGAELRRPIICHHLLSNTPDSMITTFAGEGFQAAGANNAHVFANSPGQERIDSDISLIFGNGLCSIVIFDLTVVKSQLI